MEARLVHHAPRSPPCGRVALDQEFHRLQAALPKRYTLLEELDRGGMSRVYRAREELPDREVAIKVLDEELSARLGRERFVREVEVTSKLVHPHIVPVYSAGDAGGTLYYVMPYIDGESLRDRLAREEGRLPIAEALEITREVADALQHAHDRGIVHRDVKPANILFQGGHAVVADFGIARALRAAESGGEFTQSGLPLGTPDYMSPEQAGAEGPVDGRTDTYALACVLYEMLAGQPPFHSRTSQATLARHLTDTMPPLRPVRSSVPQGVEQIITQALSKAPADRHRQVTHFADALLAANKAATEPTRSGSYASTLTPLGISLRLAGTLLAVGALGFAVQMWTSGGRSLLGGERWETSMSVVPFENRTGDPELNYLGISLADEIINHLQSAAATVRVIDTYTANSLWKENLGTPALMDSLDLEHLLHGYYDMREGQIVFWVRESDPEGSQLQLRDAHPLDPNDLNAGQAQLARTVALAFLREVGISVDMVLEGTGIGPGRDAYLTGNELLGQRTAQAMRDAIASFTESVQLEQANAPAYAGLSSAYALSLFYKYDVGMPSYELAARALAAADSAIDLDPGFANGYSARGYVRALLGIDIDRAEADFQRAEELQPNAPNAPSWNSRVLAGKGLFDDALSEAQRAKELDPLQAGRRTAIAALALQLGDYELAVAEAREAYRLEEQLDVARAFEGRALALMGRGAECLEIEFGVYELVRALCLHSLGRQREARELALAAARALTSTGINEPEHLDEVVFQDLVSYYGFIGDADNATRWLRLAFDLSPAGVEERILQSALFDPVRDDPEFAAAVIEVKADARLRVSRERARLES
jgi:serine/threonine protein kinase/tetratricopeptide (TPR) repeat protein